MENKRILVVSQYFYPEQFRINDICVEWVKRGYKVTVVTGIPNYPQNKFYDGYGWFKKRKETWQGIEIIRLPIFPRKKNILGTALSFASYVVSGFFWKLFTKLKANYVFTFAQSPITQALVGCWYAKKRKIPHILYVQDLWPDNLTAIGINNNTIVNYVHKLAKSIYRKSDYILATSPSFVDTIKERVEDKEKVHLWMQYAEDFYQPTNCNIEDLTCEAEIKDKLREEGFKIIFTGNIGYAQGLDILPKTAKILKERGGKVQFVIVGDGRYKNQFLEEIKQNGVEEYFVIVARQPATEIPKYLALSNVAFLSFMEDQLFAKTIPAKLQSYMACGMPILASAVGETERIIKEANCGKCVRLADSEGLADKIEQLQTSNELKVYGENSLRYCKENFSKKLLMDEFQEKFLK